MYIKAHLTYSSSAGCTMLEGRVGDRLVPPPAATSQPSQVDLHRQSGQGAEGAQTSEGSGGFGSGSDSSAGGVKCLEANSTPFSIHMQNCS